MKDKRLQLIERTEKGNNVRNRANFFSQKIPNPMGDKTVNP